MPDSRDVKPDVVWDFDGTILPVDSEQALLKSLSHAPGAPLGWWRAMWGRVLAWGDEHGLLPRRFKALYVRCLQGLPLTALDAVAIRLARRISPADRDAIRRVAAHSQRMVIVSCGTGDLIERILAAAGLADCFHAIEANWFIFWEGKIEGLDLAVHLDTDKLAAAARFGLALDQAVAIGDGVTDVPILDAAKWPMLLDRTGSKADLIVDRGYQSVKSLTQVADFFARHFPGAPSTR